MVAALHINGHPDFEFASAALPSVAALLSPGEKEIFDSLPEALRQKKDGKSLGFILAAAKFSYPAAAKRLLADIAGEFLRGHDLHNLEDVLTAHGRLQGQQTRRWRFVFQILRAVSKYEATRPDLGAVCTALSEYRGTYAPLRELSHTVMRKRPNLILLPDRVEFVFPGPEVLSFFGAQQRQDGSGMVRSASGQRILVEKCVLAYDVRTPGKGTILGIRSAASIARLFKRVRELRSYTEETSPAGRPARDEERSKASKLLLAYRSDTSGVKSEGGKSPAPRLKTPRVMDELRDYRDQLRNLLERGLSGENVLQIASELSGLQNDKRRGALLRWIGSLEGEIPAAVRQAGRNLRYHNSLVRMSAEDEAVQWDILVFFKIQHTYFGAGALLEPLREDAGFLRKVPADDALYGGAQSVLARLPDLERVRTGQQVTIEHVGRILDLGLLAMRAAFGERLLKDTANGLQEARNLIGELKAASSEPALFLPPWREVREHPAFQARALGMRLDSKGAPLLSKEDYEVLARFAAAEVLCLGDGTRLCRSMSIPQARRLLEEAAFTGAKAASIKQTAGVLSGLRESYLSRAELQQALGAVWKGKLDFPEIVARADSQQHKRRNWPVLNWPQLREQCLLAGQSGYFAAASLPALGHAAAKLSELICADSAALKLVISEARALLESGRLTGISGPFSLRELEEALREAPQGSKWFSPQERDFLIFMSEVKKHLAQKEHRLSPPERRRWNELKDACLLVQAGGRHRLESAGKIASAQGAVQFTGAESGEASSVPGHPGFSARLLTAAGVRAAIRQFAASDLLESGADQLSIPVKAKKTLKERLGGRKLFVRREV